MVGAQGPNVVFDRQQPHPPRDGPDEAFPDDGVGQAETDGFAEQDADHGEQGGEDEEQEEDEGALGWVSLMILMFFSRRQASTFSDPSPPII